jgi:hypothetical protein
MYGVRKRDPDMIMNVILGVVIFSAGMLAGLAIVLALIFIATDECPKGRPHDSL